MNPPANWYPDPTGRHGQRYWDGEEWTEHVFTDGVQGVDPLEAGPAAMEEEEGAAQGPGADQEDVATSTATATPGDGDGPVPNALPRRERTTPVSSTESVDEPMEGAEGLFGDTEGTDAAEPEAWAPTDTSSASDEQAEEDVAPEMEAEDVVATVDEVTESSEPDFSDAFVLAPETASRLVGRSEPTTEEEPPAAAPGPTAEEEPADDQTDEVAPAASTAEHDAPETAGGDVDLAHEDDAPDGDDVADAGDAAGDDDVTSTPLDAPPPAMPAATPATSPGLGITGDLVGGAFAEREGGGAVALQNSRMLRCAANTGIVARQGTMVAYQGDVQFERQGAGGVGRALKRAATGEGLAMMRVSGNGDVFFADGGQHVFLLHLDGGGGLSVNGRNVLAFSASLQWDIERVKGASLLAGGLFNTTLTGTGWVALVADGEPVVLRTDEAPTYVDVNALVAWSGGLTTRIVNTVSAKSLVGLGSGEAFQMAFDGAGIVIVQPSEGPMGGAAAT